MSTSRYAAALQTHKTPREKLECIVACCGKLLGAKEGADDLLPRLVYVLIKAHQGNDTPHIVSSLHVAKK